MLRRILSIGLFGVFICLSSYAAAEDSRLVASVRAGSEYDNNVLRSNEDPIGDFLARYIAALALSSEPFPRSVVFVDLTHGGKFFFEQADADTLLTQGLLGFQYRMTKGVGVYANVDIKDRTERVSRVDYNRGALGGGFDFFAGDFFARIGGSARYFAFKPTPESSSSSVEGTTRLNYSFLKELSAGVSYTYASRRFDTPRYYLEGEDIVIAPDEKREDTFHLGYASIAYRGPIVADLVYSLALNFSNSYGQNLSRHSAELTLTTPLVWEIFLTAHVELQRTLYEDPVLIDAVFLIDEDNRNAAIASLARPIGDHWELELRYSLFLQEFGVGSDYDRQTVLAALAYIFD